ncbi:MAG: hypothetical protein M1829_001256 [Trizodia sp. TS-e1964]|nr:MAG: hypothetical protein M1829_001256 [Trizodia sp. TS-e1964]
MEVKTRDPKPQAEPKGRLRSRKSIAHLPSPDTQPTLVDKENATVDIGRPTVLKREPSTTRRPKNSRSKSLGPGGLDALKEGAGNRRKSVVGPAVKSILKPTIPLSPLREIPKRKVGGPSLNSETASCTLQNRNISTGSSLGESKTITSGAEGLPNPSESQKISPQNSMTISLKTEEEQQALSREREEKEKREEEKKEILARRDARRKSLANRRVSFAPEATLHTWDVVEYFQELTSSSASTNSTRRDSAVSSAPPLGDTTEQATTPDRKSDSPEIPSEALENSDVNGSAQLPAQKNRRRRSSIVPPINFNDPNDEAFSSSPCSGSSAAGSDATDGQSLEADADSNSADESDDGQSTMMDLDEEITSQSYLTARSAASSSGSSGRLEEALRQAARVAGTQGIEFDENGDLSMELADDEVTGAFKPWIEKTAQPAQASSISSDLQDQENQNPFSPAFLAGTIAYPNIGEYTVEDHEISMDLTRAIGGIRTTQPAAQLESQDVAGTGTPVGNESFADEVTMDLTMAVGGIRAVSSQEDTANFTDDDEEMSMELTTAIGEVFDRSTPEPEKFQPEILVDITPDTPIAIPVASEKCLPPATSTLDTGSPIEMKVRASARTGNRVSITPKTSKRVSITPKSGGKISTTPMANSSSSIAPLKKYSTPTKQPTPRLQRPRTPVKTPQSKNAISKIDSPKPLFNHRLNNQVKTQTPKQASPTGEPLCVFTPTTTLFPAPNQVQGFFTPIQDISPSKRQLSGIGADREGIGSPHVAALLDRRQSIEKNSSAFLPARDRGNLLLDLCSAANSPANFTIQKEAFNLPQVNGNRTHQRGVVFQDALKDPESTLTLKEMIQSLTPKKKLHGRKSLAVGAGKGLLGKRPIELDEDDDEQEFSPKRLKGRDESPVKKIRLPPPPPKQLKISETSPIKLSSPVKMEQPKAHSSPDQKIKLQEFLDLTSIRFLELTTTKRRQTIAPTSKNASIPTRGDENDREDKDRLLERCVVAGVCTLPMLELYQHSCRELKKYISEGRSIVREIETDTFKENPPLFLEYITAAPDVRMIMDNQFKNVKAHARLLSKGMWYEWRMKLLEGLKTGFSIIQQGMDADEEHLQRQEQLLDPVIPGLLEENERLSQQHELLKLQAVELENCNQEDLESARKKLAAVEKEIEAKKTLLQGLQRSLVEKQERTQMVAEIKQEWVEEIKEAERVREECRGWSASEVGVLKAKVDSFESKHGWNITAAAGSHVTMTFRREIQLGFNLSSFLANKSSSQFPTAPNSSIGLSYIAMDREQQPLVLSTERKFFIQAMRAHLQRLDQGRTKLKDLLGLVSSLWRKADTVAEQIRRLNQMFMTKVAIESESELSVKASVLLATLLTKIEIELQVTANPEGEFSVIPSARVVYGNSLNDAKMGEVLAVKICGMVDSDQPGDLWVSAVRDLEARLIARGKR